MDGMVNKMGIIQVLTEQIANQIAAGEVVERPASVIKELVENAIDAKSTRVEVTIEEGGLQYIRVMDNGCGMSAEDGELAFHRHATSKIKDGRDLFQIRTLGFRGEALPSIAAVSKTECITSDNQRGLGRKIVIHGGQVVEHGDCASSQGTDIRVRDLFYNTPARLKYMKTVQTELSHISDYLYRMALAHPNVAFQLHHNGQQLLHTLGNGDLQQTIAAIYGTSAARQMLAIEANTIDYQLTGLVSKPELNRSNRNGITLIVNGRVIKNYSLVQSLLEAYHTLLPLHRFPLVVLCLQMDPLLVDVNVHPAKLEVRFSKEVELNALIKQTVRNSLLATNLVPQMTEVIKAKDVTYQAQTRYTQNSPTQHTNPQRLLEQPTLRLFDKEPLAQPLPEQVRESLTTAPEITVEPKLPMMFPVGQIHGTYIVAQNEQGMYLIDQHAAHERLNYELFFEQMANVQPIAQELLIPITLNRTASELQVLSTRLHILEAIGVYLEPFGGNSLIVRAYPSWFPDGEEQNLIEEMVEWLLREKQSIQIGVFREKAAIMCSCKASIKANHAISIREMEVLIERLRAAKVPFTCPHGRPIVVSFSSYDLQKLFKRVM
jgi:DNA mismatch repair protein MutL